MSELDYSDWEKELKGEVWQWDMVKRLAFSFDAEHMHELAIKFLNVASFFIRKDLNANDLAREPIFSKSLMGLTFRNPIGLSAGFDVDAECLPAMQHLGFGYIEVGGITKEPQNGNPKPRLFRLPKDKAIINRLNFYNKGASRLRERLTKLREAERIFVPIGINLGKSNSSNVEDVPDDYLATFKEIHDVADYITINVSCPNALGLEKYQSSAGLKLLLDKLDNFNESLPKKLPLLLKLGPDLNNEEAMACAEIAIDYGLSGLVISNTTTKRYGLITEQDFGAGGLSGRPLFERSTQLLRCIAKDYGKKLTLIGSGGIMEGSHALTKLNAGADILQVYTGFVYNGPTFVYHLLKYLRLYHFS